MSNKIKQQHLTKEQIIAQAEQKKLMEKRMKFINETFMPTMDSISKNLEEAQFITDSTKQAIAQAFQNTAREVKVKDLHLVEQLQKVKKPELVQNHIKVLEMLGEQTVDDSLKLCDALYNEVDKALVEEKKTRKISDFNKK